ncbi:hypothetical protein QQ008_28915 [Fulvivirgaceae bacterium BMA10]|uniref:Uncharacterized protein n=1 Tax=Splendidivirga corallicola TaxID=3051826 RepID=A0ABT8KZU9_9BACT|nr:hypothetical protein [Fulvivirgaceae bacterium BMA10]
MNLDKSLDLKRFILFILFLTFFQCVNAQTVYTTRTGSKYHRENCRYLHSSKIKKDLSEAIKYYGACKVCKPPTQVTKKKSTRPEPTKPTTQPGQKQNTPSKSSKAKSVQCSGNTKAGNRCKRMTTNTNGRCWQH